MRQRHFPPADLGVVRFAYYLHEYAYRFHKGPSCRHLRQFQQTDPGKMPGIVLGPEGSLTEDWLSRLSCMPGPLCFVTWAPGPSVGRGQDGVLGSPGLAQATGL